MNLTSIISGDYIPELLQDETLPQLLTQSFLAFPQKTALIFKDQSITYKELDSWSNAVADLLIQNGVSIGDSVGLWWPRGLELPVIVLGILKAGANYVPLDREMPAERIKTAFTEIGPIAYFSDQTLDIPSVKLSIPSKPKTFYTQSSPRACNPDHRAYILFTSGSTGKPKGIAITHRQICHFIRSEQTVLNIQPKDRVYQGFSISFDMWCEETWITLFAGATLWIADIITAKSAENLSEVLREAQINVLHAVPSLLAVMDEHIPSLHTINAGGEACTPQVLARWARSDIRFFNSYGPTEATVSSSIAKLKQGDVINIGKPLPNCHIAVVDENLHILPRGQKGELIISSPGVAEGYIQRPDLSKEKFLFKPSFMEALPGERIYRTGDMAIIKEDGTIEFHGRLDDQVKLNGYRIELGEIESLLANFPDVAAAAAALKKDHFGQERLIAYVVPKQDHTLDTNAIRQELTKLLPFYMIPSQVVVLNDLPRLTNGKINRNPLPSPDATSNAQKTQLSNKNIHIAAQLLSVLETLFPGKEITLEDDFFTDLGGHSLLAATFLSRLRNNASMPCVSLKDIYQNRSVQAMIARWEASEEGTANSFE